ncbi:MAG: ATP-dependent DNA helicase RecG [Endomicrobia bacterium]|nr:ATP-dependent DNA helicase RecG [Endomicrobiia bacterium]MCL2506720.1 ATP-dependent DNA helicase RecG [Endomicrobiia bacterium]
MINLDSEIQYIKGIGPKRAQHFAKLGIKNAGDLLTFFPADYQDRSKIVQIVESYKQPHSCVFAKIGKSFQKSFYGGLSVLDVEILDDSGMGYARFFRKKNPYSKIDIFSSLKNAFQRGFYAYICGETKAEFGARYILVSDYEIVQNINDKPLFFNRIMPVYALTEGITQKVARETVKTVLDSSANLYPDISSLIPDFDGVPKMPAWQSLKKIHYPGSFEERETARRSFALQEFFVLESALAITRNKNKKSPKTQKYEIKKNLLTPFKNNLTFEFTHAQKKAINEIFADMQNIYPMNRMLMGDVGSGKTVAALSAILFAVENGYQTMIAAPTEILAEQHFLTISNMLSGLDVKVSLVTSSSLKKKSEAVKILADIESGETKIAIGTHALIEDRVKFKNLSLIVVDEQHRFGVMQKFAALDKAQTPDILMMTATPIPRALSMTVYGEMDMTVIDELPPGRIPIKTYYISESGAYNKTIAELKNGGQAYIVYPLIDESDKVELKSAVAEAEKLSHTVFKDFKVGLLHGKMKPSEKNEIMKSFKNKGFDVLIATTVIEVGIDVPNASVIIIQHADRFGLSALHQLRGRVGRGQKQSYCFLVGLAKSENARRRLDIMTKTNNGFEIAEEDLRMRGPGELMGTVQHGFPEFKAGDLIRDVDIIEFAKNHARQLVETDPKLSKKENAVLKQLINQRFAKKTEFIKVG